MLDAYYSAAGCPDCKEFRTSGKPCGAHGRGGVYSAELDALYKIERFGLEAITGRRQFYYGELRKMIIAENIVTAYRHRKASKDWADWARENPDMASLLLEVEKCL